MAHYSQRDDLFPMAGACPCHQTTFTIHLAPLLVHACYCQTCQQQTGGILALNAIVETSALQVQHAPPTTPPGYREPFAKVTGADQQPQEAMALKKTCVPSPSGVGTTLVGCPTCGTTIYTHYADAGRYLAYVRVGLLERASDITPDAHIYTAEKASFVAISDGKPQYRGYYADRSELYREEVKDRVEALAVMVGQYQEMMAM
ncbi:Mss4-like protein [Emericellopsis atlantica]|uniref:Mss4-like protein n=1 Tax=Emericellopsis atlantica TaxID=2614577 RepID=A0A9P7ZT23_9HYPO|nr:Mss4-like protein [Emericellopsis atlantica]KAG9257828.1 Mss4-like protein [Emericellopsis atlantica]